MIRVSFLPRGATSCLKRVFAIAFLLALARPGLRAAGAVEVPVGPVIELPPMIVAGSAKGPPWLYAQTNVGEFLSRCSASTTRQFIETRQRLVHVLQILVPEEFFVRMDVPGVTILDAQGRSASNDAVVQEMMKQEGRGNRPPDFNPAEGGRGRGGARPRVQFLPNLRLEDRDTTALFAFLDENNFDGSRLFLSPDFVRFLLARRTPMLPPWLIEGIMAIYVQANMAGDPIVIRPFEWLSVAESQGLERDPERPRTLFAMPDLFKPDTWRASEEDGRRIKVWQGQAALFFRWALDPRNAGARDAFWKFARRASEEAVTEVMFEECFGFGYSEMRDRLSDYLPLAVKNPLRIPRGKLPRLPRIEVNPAKPAQIARLRGEWERMEIPFVKARHPEFVSRYTDQARRTLHRGLEQGEADPRVVSSLALCELDAGNEQEARPLLERAVAAQVARPRVYYELARLRYLELTTGQPAERRYSPQEIEPVVSLLRIPLKQQPPLPENYLMLAQTWLFCTGAPPAEDFATLQQGTNLFLWRPILAHRVALLNLAHGRIAEARAILAESMQRTNDPAVRSSLAEMQAFIDRPKPR
ncbi:MAG: hypothetical protein RIQ93_2535 [Verrucomicrobiota bacterium]|jgi:hypothetical protein